MLKAYSYVEHEPLNTGVIDEDIFVNERRLISEFVSNNPTSYKVDSCIICGGAIKEFAVIDKTSYQRCVECCSIFAPVEDGIVERYKTYPPLLAFRNSAEYQQSAAEKRDAIWDDLLFWLGFRLARYSQQSTGLDIIDFDNRYTALSEKIRRSKFCGSYNVSGTADVILFFDQFRCLNNPIDMLLKLRGKLKDDGILIMSTRVGSGFDVLVLKGGVNNVFPYECILLPSTEGLTIILEKAGFRVLEISTPGTLDIEHVIRYKEQLRPDDLFVDYLLNKTDVSILAEFQRFLQKSGMSSHALVIAKKI